MTKKTNPVFCLAFFALTYLSCSPKINSSAPVNLIKVMTYNIHHANPPSKKELIDLDAIAKVINDEKPDIVGLQEVDRFTRRSGQLDEAKVLAGKTGLFFHFFKAIAYDGGDYGVAILSRYPIRETNSVALPQVIRNEERVLGYAKIAIGNVDLTFANTHLDASRPDSNRVVQMKTVLAQLAEKKGQVILVGDLNCEAKSQPIMLLDQQFTRSCTTDCEFTIPQIAPRKTIDYIAAKDNSWKVVSHRVIAETYASDHRPVVATYSIAQ